MTTSLDDLKGYLKESDIKFEDKDGKVLIVLSGDKDTTQGTFIRLKDDGDMFSMETNLYDQESNMIKLDKNSKHYLATLTYILHTNFELKFGTWAVDKNDGEISFNVGFPLKGNSITQEQFKRVISIVLGKQAFEMFQDVRNIIKTGQAKIEIAADEMEEFLKWKKEQEGK